MTQTMSKPTTTQQTLSQPQYEITPEDKARIEIMQKAWQAYNGQLPPPLQKLAGQPDDNVLSNRCQPIVDAGVDFLFGKEIEISVEDDAPGGSQDILNSAWGIKEQRIPLFQDLAMNGACCGTAFLRLVPGSNNTVRLIVVDPTTVYVQTAPQDVETVLVYCIEYNALEKVNGKVQPVYYREEIARLDPDGNASRGLPDDDDTWQIGHWSRVGERGPWQPAGAPLTWPYPFPPLFACKNLPKPNSFWGNPDLTPDLIGMNSALNLVQSNVNRILKLFGQPILFAVGVGESVIDIKPGRIIGLGDPAGKIESVPIVSEVAGGLDFAVNLRSDMDEQSRVPGVATGRIAEMPRGNLSGIAIELLFMSLLNKTEGKRCRYGKLIIDVSKALLALSGISPDFDISIAWQSPIPHDDLTAIQAAIAKREIGISDSTIMRELSYDPEEELALSQTEDAIKLANFTRGAGLPPAIPGTKPLPGQKFPEPAPGAPPPQQGGQQ